MARHPSRSNGSMTRRRRRLLLRLALAAAVATLIVTRYTSPKSLFKPIPETSSGRSPATPR